MLRAASVSHLRVDIEPDAPGWRAQLARAALDARALEAGLEPAIFLPSDPGSLDEVASAMGEEQVPVARVLAFSRDEPVATAQTVALVRERLGAVVGSAPIVGGTNVFFTDINRFRPDLTQVDGIAWPITATVHASDDASVAEMPPMHGETVRSARAFCSDRTLHVTPVTFNMRFNPHATGPLPAVAAGELPPQVDRRQPSLPCAVDHGESAPSGRERRFLRDLLRDDRVARPDRGRGGPRGARTVRLLARHDLSALTSCSPTRRLARRRGDRDRGHAPARGRGARGSRRRRAAHAHRIPDIRTRALPDRGPPARRRHPAHAR